MRRVLVSDIHHVSINVAETQRALGFYRDVLGLTVLPRPELSVRGAWLDAGNGRQVHLVEADVPPDLGQHVAFRVSDIDTVIMRLREAGTAVRDAKPVGDTGGRQTFAFDPDGNRVEFNQPA